MNGSTCVHNRRGASCGHCMATGERHRRGVGMARVEGRWGDMRMHRGKQQ